MENRDGKIPARVFHAPTRLCFISYYLVLVVSAGALLGSCAAPGLPVPRRPKMPEAVSDLDAHQSGDSIALTFTLPKVTTEGQPLAEPPAIEIYRTFLSPGAPAVPGKPAAPATLAYTIPPSLVDPYVVEGRVHFVDRLRPEDVARFAGGQAVYSVRTRASKKKDSADSNVVALRVIPTGEPIHDLAAQVTKTAIELSWTPAEKGASGGAPGSLAGYHIYRAEAPVGTETGGASEAKLAARMQMIRITASPGYRDSHFEFGHTYIYSVRSVTQVESGSVESADSGLVVVTPRDTFAPAPPRGLVVVFVPGTAQTLAHLELSWGISPEPDLAGYYVYRIQETGRPGERQNHDLLLTPVFRDMSVQPGYSYSYTVTAVDRAGNESLPSEAVSAAVPAENESVKP
jgi:uncharacterized protein